MKLWLFSLAAGILVGVIYGLMNVRSPAPPLIALLGLLGILVGEQITAAGKRAWSSKPLTLTWVRAQCMPQILGTGANTKPSPAGAEETNAAVE